jgi:hypothetical protein
MKQLLILLSLLALNGCAVYDAVTMTKYDPNEYLQVTEIKVDAADYAAKCSDTKISRLNAMAMAHKTRMFAAYSEHLPSNGDGFKAATSLDEIAQGLAVRYNSGDTVSTLFCKLKFEGIEHSADTIQHVLGNRPR